MSKVIALIAHDNMKQSIMEWCMDNIDILKNFELCGTGTTAKKIREATGLNVHGYSSGPLGGDQQIGSLVAVGEIDVIIFFYIVKPTASPITKRRIFCDDNVVGKLYAVKITYHINFCSSRIVVVARIRVTAWVIVRNKYCVRLVDGDRLSKFRHVGRNS